MKLKDLGVGDKVCIVTRAGVDHRIRRLEVGEIERVTKAQITAFGCRWMISTGCEVGLANLWNAPQIIPYTQKIQDEFDEDKKTFDAETSCKIASDILSAARGDDALLLTDLAKKVIEAGKDTE